MSRAMFNYKFNTSSDALIYITLLINLKKAHRSKEQYEMDKINTFNVYLQLVSNLKIQVHIPRS